MKIGKKIKTDNSGTFVGLRPNLFKHFCVQDHANQQLLNVAE